MIVPKPQSGHFMGELPFVRLGDSPRTLVIFPALGDVVRDFTDLAWRLAWYYRGFADDYRVYLISRKRGLPAGYSTRQMAVDYADVFERSISGPADVVGLSMGGLIAQHFAADFPQYVRRLVTGVAALRLGTQGERMVRRWSTLAQQERWREIHADSVELMYTGMRRSLYGFLVRHTSERRLPKPVNPSDYVY